jgi:acyl carrier protein
MSYPISNPATNSISNSTEPNLVTQHTFSQHTVESVQDWLVAQVAEQLGLNPEDINIQAPLDTYGLESMQVMIITSKAEKKLGIKIPLMMLLHYPTIEALSHRVTEDLDQSDVEVFQI